VFYFTHNHSLIPTLTPPHH